MKKTLFTLFILASLFCTKTLAQKEEQSVMTLKGLYAGKNIFVKNPYCTNGRGFPIRKIVINGQLSPADFVHEIFEIALDLKGINLKQGDSVKIEIYYIKNCSPRNKPSIMNPGVLLTYGNGSIRKENTLTIEGQFYWNNLFVINKYNTETKSYGIKEVKVNGKIVTYSINKDVFELDIVSLGAIEGQRDGLKEGDKLIIEFKYDKDNGPFILNPEVIDSFN